ncbi:MAG: putative drug exporter of the superfamily [Gaiellales bacterium]|nr:putative drug exporter of the superfamily [Gaiellales bacterium]
MSEHISPDAGRNRPATGALADFARMCARHPRRVVGIWFLATVALIAAVVVGHGTLVNEFKLPGSDTQRATDLLKAKFPAQNGSSLTFVFQAKPGQKITSPTNRAAIDKIIALSKKAQYATRTTSPFDKGNLSKTGRVGFFDQTFSKQSFDLSWTKTKALMDKSQAIASAAGMNLQFTGEASSGAPSSGTSEIFGLIAGLIVMLFLFRAFVPTVIPLIFAIIAVASAFMLLYLAAAVININNITPIIASMIGLGVGIDYSLFIVTRFRQLLHDGLSPQEAAAGAAATAGRAVIFAGITVAISITGLFAIGLQFITVMGIGGALGVLTAVILANTLLPAVLAMLGHKIDRGGMRLPQADESFEGQQTTPVARWGRFVTSHAPVVFAVSLVLALLLAAPALKVRLGAADAGTAPKSNTTRQAYDILSDKKDGFGPGFTSPITVVVKGDKAQANKVYTAMQGITGKKGDLVFVSRPFANKAGDVSIINAYSKFSPQDSKTDDLVSLLRKKVVPSTGVTAYVTGQNAAFTDIGNQILRRLPWFLLFIIGVTVVLLTMAFRSLVIAIKAALSTLLSAFVGFGVLVGVVQLGHGMGILGLDRTGPIESFVPPIAFAILFGLSMDYEVFLMSRVREEHVRGKATRQALTDGIAGVGRVIVAAALIMSSVFFSFTIGDDRITKEFGLLLGIAILCDALLVRMTMVPALLTMLGERSWLIPGWLDKALPNLTVEPPGTIEHDLPAGVREPTPEPGPA